MEFSTYQRAARQTSQLRLGGPQGAIAPMLGLASETGSILNVYKKYLRDGIDLAANREFLREELGDLLWYVAAVATAFGLDLEEIATANLQRTRDRYPSEHPPRQRDELPVFDALAIHHTNVSRVAWLWPLLSTRCPPAVRPPH
jgi:NTP pyrophosphatase (non-canonical NTP hydrolase)